MSMRTFLFLMAALWLAGCSADKERWYQRGSKDITPADSALATRGIWLAQAPYRITLDGKGNYEICSLNRKFLRPATTDRCETGLVDYGKNFRVILLNFRKTEIGSQLLRNANFYYDMDDNQVDAFGDPIPDGAYDFSPQRDRERQNCQYRPCRNLGRQDTDRYVFVLERSP